jgi:hypothetical protein
VCSSGEGAEREGFEPSMDVTAHTGFSRPAQMN